MGSGFLDFLATIIGTSLLGVGNIEARGLASVILAAGVLALLFYRG